MGMASSLDFSRPIPLFPLPNCVLFPGAVQPLHIFEPRYRDVTAAALKDQSALALALLQSGWEQQYYGAPPIHAILCAGIIVAHELLPDGKYNLLLHGVTRAKVLREDNAGDAHPYRTAMLQPLDDHPPMDEAGARFHRNALYHYLTATPLSRLTIASSLLPLFDADDPLPTPRLIDVLAFTLIQDIPTRQQLLEQRNPLLRGQHLLRELTTLAKSLEARTAWPPPQSNN
jgi:Lon protease-like protein